MTGAGRAAVISGVGIVSSLGIGVEAVLGSLRDSRSGLRAQPPWIEAGLAAHVAGTPADFDEAFAAAGVPHRLGIAMAPVARYAVVAAREAIRDAGLPADLVTDSRTACLVGCGVGDVETMARGAREVAAGRPRRIDPYSILRAMGSAPVAALVATLGLRGPASVVSSACASSAHALHQALLLIRSGAAETVLVGGAEAIELHLAAAFDAMRGALASGGAEKPEALSRPFSAARRGFVLGSGAAFLVVESEASAARRGVTVRARLLGAAAGSDPADPVLPATDGAAAAQVMTAAIADGGIEPARVDLVLAHATATPAGDPAEATALRRVFGERLPRVAATKGLAGHALGAAAAIDAVVAVLSLEHGFQPGSPTSFPLDPTCADLPLSPSTRPGNVDVVVANAFGFGGALGSVVFGSAGVA